MLARVWIKGNPLKLLVGMQTSTATMENSVETPLKTGNRIAIWPSNPTAGHKHWGNQNWKRYVYPNVHWSTVYNSQDTWCKELTHLKRPWCWERLKAGGEGDDRGWDGWMASPARWTRVWASSGSWWWTGKPGVLQSMGLQRVGHNWVTELNWGHGSKLDLHWQMKRWGRCGAHTQWNIVQL